MSTVVKEGSPRRTPGRRSTIPGGTMSDGFDVLRDPRPLEEHCIELGSDEQAARRGAAREGDEHARNDLILSMLRVVFKTVNALLRHRPWAYHWRDDAESDAIVALIDRVDRWIRREDDRPLEREAYFAALHAARQSMLRGSFVTAGHVRAYRNAQLRLKYAGRRATRSEILAEAGHCDELGIDGVERDELIEHTPDDDDDTAAARLDEALCRLQVSEPQRERLYGDDAYMLIRVLRKRAQRGLVECDGCGCAVYPLGVSGLCRRCDARRRAKIEDMLRDRPDCSDRWIAALVPGATWSTVNRARSALVAAGEIPRCSRRAGRDGRTTRPRLRDEAGGQTIETPAR